MSVTLNFVLEILGISIRDYGVLFLISSPKENLLRQITKWLTKSME